MARLIWLLIAGLAVGTVYLLQTVAPSHLRVTAMGILAWSGLTLWLVSRRDPTRLSHFATLIAGGASIIGAAAIAGRWREGVFWGVAAVTLLLPIALSAGLARWRAGPRALVAVGLVGGLGLLAVLLGILFPPTAWGDLILSDDFPIVHYNTAVDLRAWAAGGPFGWDDAVTGGRTTVLSLRTLAPFVAPFVLLGLPLELVLLLVYFIALLAFPVLVGLLLAAQAEGDRLDRFGWGVVGGALLGVGYVGNLYQQGMIYSMVALDLTLVQLIAVEGLMRRRRGGAVLLGVAGALAVWVHIAQLLFGLMLVGIAAVAHVVHGRRPDARGVIGAGLIALGGASPFLLALWTHRAALAPNYLAGTLVVIDGLRALGPFGAIEALAALVLWEFPGFIRTAAAALPLAGLAFALARGYPGVRAAAIALVVVLIAAFCSWIPSVGFAMLRVHFFVPLLVAMLVGLIAWRSTGLGRAALFVTVGLMMIANPHVFWPVRHYHARDLEAAEPKLVAAVRALPGRRVLYENTAGQSPLRDLRKPYDEWPGIEVQRGGVLALASGRKLFAHPGWDPYPYHRYRDAFIVNGAWRGVRMTDIDADAFHEQLARYGVGGAVVWSEAARGFFAARPERYRRVGFVPARTDRFRTAQFTAFEVIGADARGARVEGGEGTADVVSEGPFHFSVDVAGVPAGRWIRVVTRHLAGWRATVDGRPAEVAARDGLLAVRVPAANATRIELHYDRRHRHLWIAVAITALGMGLAMAARRRRSDGRSAEAGDAA